MDFWNWIGVGAGLALAIRELYPVWNNRRNIDAEWKRGLLWGCVALAGALAAGVSGILSSAEAKELRAQISHATTTATNANRRAETVEQKAGHLEREAQLAKRRTISTEQADILFADLAEINNGEGRPLFVVVAAQQLPRSSMQYAEVLASVLYSVEVGQYHVENVPTVEHDGLVMYVSEETVRNQKFADVMRSAELPFKFVVGPPPDADFGEWSIRKSHDMAVLYVGGLE